ncbi:MAG: hypothetical protein K6D61_03790 [Prevotella sp.]|nr:hypothetical protein [Prevotella sp.]
MKKLLSIIFLLISLTSVQAQDISYNILVERDSTVKAKLGSLTLGSREVKYFVYEYPSTDPDGQAVNISGVIMVPSDIVSGNTPCDGIIMYNHYTIGAMEDAPSIGGKGLEAISAAISNPLKPNYIFVASDYIGYGSSASHPAAYLCGDTNARNCLDGLLAARKLLEDKQIPQGKHLFNLGFSQGGTESMFAAKLTDTEDKYKGIRFDKTFSGGGPLDYETIYKAYVERDDCEDVADVVFFLINVNENCHLGIDYAQLFKEPMASKAQEYFTTKDKGVVSAIGVTSMEKISEVLQPAYMDLTSDESKALQAALKNIGVMEGWEPDLTKRYYIEHSRHDNYVPIQSVRGIIPWMTEKGFKPTIVPGKSNLQTATLVFKLKHQQSGIVWAIQTMAAIQFWPVLYYEGEQNRYYHEVVHDLNLMKVVKTLESWGIDLHKIVSDGGNAPAFDEVIESGIADGTLDPNGSACQILTAPLQADFLTTLMNVLGKLDLTLQDAYEMLADSGITIMDILEVYNYIKNGDEGSAPEFTLEQDVEAPLYLLRSYEQQLATWYMLAGFDVNYDAWGN